MKPSHYGILSTLPRFWFGITAIVFVLASLAPAAAAPPEETTNSLGMKLVAIRAGEFTMGRTEKGLDGDRKHVKKTLKKDLTNAGDGVQQQEAAKARYSEDLERVEGQSPEHHVVISKPFWLGKFKVTQKEYSAVMGHNPSEFQAKGAGASKWFRMPKGMDTSSFPADRMTWEDAAEFCRQVSAMPDEVAAGRTYRLPTEAEWEYACLAGTTTTYYWGDKSNDQMDYEWIVYNSDNHPHPVGEKRANPWGLFDMCGNCFEACADWFDPKYYQASPERDPPGPASGEQRVYRGWSFNSNANYANPRNRNKQPPSQQKTAFGFRVACDIKQVAKKADAPATLPEAGKKAEAQLKQKGLISSQSGYFVLPAEKDFVRYISTIERLRVNCFHAQKEAKEAKRQLSLARAAQEGAVKARQQASRVAGYSLTWRDHWNVQRIHNQASDAVLLAQLSKEDVEAWNKEVQEDFQSSLELYGAQIDKLKTMYKKLQTDYSMLADDQTVTQALTAMNTGGKVSYRLGPSPNLSSAMKKLENEETLYAKLKGK